MAKLILFDLDGTLFDILPHHLASYDHALKKVFSVPYTAGVVKTNSGRTTYQILRDWLKQHDIEPTLDDFDVIDKEMARYMEENLDGSGLLPGTRAVLQMLRNETEHTLGIATGNSERLTKSLLNAHGIQNYFHFYSGAGHGHDRVELLKIAIEKAQKEQTFDEIVYVCDAQLDVQAAKKLGITALAVASGCHSLEELKAEGADHVFPSMEDSHAVVSSLTKSVVIQ